jgi:hypothetical protein
VRGVGGEREDVDGFLALLGGFGDVGGGGCAFLAGVGGVVVVVVSLGGSVGFGVRVFG